MLLLVGLGNPGSRYARNRHNIGFMALDEIIRRQNLAGRRSRFRSEVVEGAIGSEKVLAMKPQTFMNRSGEAVGEAARFFKLTPEQIIVFHDELDLAPGKLRVKKGGGNAGHNGLRSIASHIGNDFWRVRLGIGRPGDKALVHGYVLSDFGKDDGGTAAALCEAVGEEIPRLLEGDHEAFMSRVAHHLQPSKESSSKDG